MVKKILISIFVLLLIGSISICASEKIYELSLADSTAPVGLRGEGLKVFLEEIEKHTNGRVKMNVFWGESLLKAQEMLKGVKDGVVDMGFLNPNYYPEQLFLYGSFALHPQGPTNFLSMSKVYNRVFEEFSAFQKELEEKNNQKILYNTAILSCAIVSTKPFTSFEDFKGKRIRAASSWWMAQLKGAGAVPVSVPWGDCYMALQTGTIDAVFTNYDGEHRTKLDEPAPHVLTFKELWYGLPIPYTINLDTWNSLPEDIQTQLINAGKAAEARFSELFDKEWDSIVQAQKEMGCIVNAASKEDIEKWVNMPVIVELQAQWTKDAVSRGVEDADRIMSRMAEIIAEELEQIIK